MQEKTWPITGEYPTEGQSTGDVTHFEGFALALDDALKKWEKGDPSRLKIRFEADIKENPGGIGTYRILLGGSG